MIFPKTIKQKQRFKVLLIALLMFFIGASLVLYSLKNFIVYYYTITEIHNKTDVIIKKTYRIGGLVKPNSIEFLENTTYFILSDSLEDSEHEIKVSYTGPLPSLFREGVGTIAEGFFDKNSTFVAKILLAKHDETYKPPALQE